MRIDQIRIQNFKKFTDQEFQLSPRLNLFIGDNGSGKTSVLDALAIALGIWHKATPGSGWRQIRPEEIRLEPVREGDRILFKKSASGTTITAKGVIGAATDLCWKRAVKPGGARTTSLEAKQAELAVRSLLIEAEKHVRPLPVLGYYGAGRGWQTPNKPRAGERAQRLDAYRSCLDTRIHVHNLNDFFLYEAAATHQSGSERPGFRAVKAAVLDNIPGADNVRYEADLKEIVLSIHGQEQPFSNLSAGQGMMLALIGDIAIKAVQLNSYLLGPDRPGAAEPREVLRQSPGVVLIDELDVHLHPSWQRRVAGDLCRTFPKIQFVCTSHSPQVVGEIPRDEVWELDAEGHPFHPQVARGADSNWLLDHVMDASSATATSKELQRTAQREMSAGNFASARGAIEALRTLLEGKTGDLIRLESSLRALETMAGSEEEE